MKTSSKKTKKESIRKQVKRYATTRDGRRGMSLAEWQRQNEWPSFEACLRVGQNRLRPSDPYGRIYGLHPEDAMIIAQLREEYGNRGIPIRTLAWMYFPDAENAHCAVAQLAYELRCCNGLTERLEQLHHPKHKSRFTCAQLRAIFLLYGSPGA